MAIRKKSETIHLRVNPISKALLEGLANQTKKTSTQVIEDLIEAAADAIFIDIDEVLDEKILRAGKLSLRRGITLAMVNDQPLLTKLRLWHLASDALSSKDFKVIAAINNNQSYFNGSTEIFSKSEKLIKPEIIDDIKKFDLEKIVESWSTLEAYVDFREKNPKWKPDFEAFYKMTLEGEQL